MYKLGTILTIITVFLIAGCASEVQPIPNMATSVQEQPGKVIYISITAAPAITSDSDYSSSMAEFQSTLSKKIEDDFPGTQVVFSQPPSGAASGQKMNIAVLDFRYVSGSGRFWGGILVGKARLQVRVQITDMHTGKLTGDSSMGTSSSTGAGIFGATTSRQIDGVTNAIVNMLGGGTPSTPQ